MHQGWYNDDIDTLKRKIELREKTIKEFKFIKDGGVYKEYQQMKIRLKELEEKQSFEEKNEINK